jgi:hypothetical protein
LWTMMRQQVTVPKHHGANFPHHCIPANPVLRPTNLEMDKVVSGLCMLENLLPGPINPLLPPRSIHLHGEILMENRKNHGRMKGIVRMSIG